MILNPHHAAIKKKRMQHPLPPAPAGQVITEKSCARCRIRKGEQATAAYPYHAMSCG